MARKKKGKNKKAAAGPKAGDRGQLVGLISRTDLNGRRVEVPGRMGTSASQKQTVGKDWKFRLKVRLLFGAGAGTVLKVKVENLDLDRDRVLDPAMATLVAEMQALAPGATPPEERRDWAGLPVELLAKIAETHIARTKAGWAAHYKQVLGWTEKETLEQMAKRERDGTCCLFVFAMVCKEWRKAQLKVGGPLRSRVESDVIMPGSVALVKWALAEGGPRAKGNGATVASAAAQYGHMALVQWLIQEQGFAMTRTEMGMAARGGNIELVQWLRGEGCDWCAWACECAAEAGRLGVLKWLRANGCPWDAETCNQAAKHGHLETLRWARENGCDWNARTCLNAAYGGHLEILQWLRAEGCPWDWKTCYNAVEGGHVEVLRWARENDCPWHATTRDRAAAELGYTDDFGNVVDSLGNPV